MEAIWVVLIATLLAFCSSLLHRRSYRKGYKAGATKVLEEWKKSLYETGND